MGLIKAKIFRKTQKGDWMARTQDGTDVLLPQKDRRLAIGIEIEIDEIRKGEHVYFPLSYDLPGLLEVKKVPVAHGIIKLDYVLHGHGDLLDHWSAFTEQWSNVNLNKRTGPSDVGIGTMVDIYAIARKGVVHWYVDDWGKSRIQYPSAPLTEEQNRRVRELTMKLNDPEIGTVALSHSPYQTVVLDEGKPGRRTTEIYGSKDGFYLIGTRILIGMPKENADRRMVYAL